LPPGKIGGAIEPGTGGNLRSESLYGPNAGLIPAGYVKTVYDPVFKLSADGMRFVPTLSDEPTPVPDPGMPFSLVFRCDPGREDILLKIASAYGPRRCAACRSHRLVL
jgi:amidase